MALGMVHLNPKQNWDGDFALGGWYSGSQAARRSPPYGVWTVQ